MTTTNKAHLGMTCGELEQNASDIANKYDVKVPRYTSYPTAPHFTDAVDETAYRRWLQSLATDSSLSLYFHVPFCDSMCWFCGCYTKIVRHNEPVAQYIDVLCREAELIAQALPARLQVHHIHWGGGSPTLIKPDQWRRTIAHLREHFDLDELKEMAVELDPRDLTRDYVAGLAEAGVSRVSIGVQDFDETVQIAVNRVQPFKMVSRACDWLREHGIGQINFDLMYGLPFQSAEGIAALAEQAVQLQPSRIALFGYAHVPWMKSHQKLIPEHALPGAAARLNQFNTATAVLTDAGYHAIGLDHFAHPGDALARAAADGRLHRNFQGYTTDEATALIGFGASAIGRFPQGYAQNTAPLKAYGDGITAGRLPIARGVALSAQDRVRREIIERLMCDLRVDVAAVCQRHNVAASDFDDAFARLARLVQDGLVILDGTCVEVPDDRRAFVRLAAVTFDAHHNAEQDRHARAV